MSGYTQARALAHARAGPTSHNPANTVRSAEEYATIVASGIAGGIEFAGEDDVVLTLAPGTTPVPGL